MTTTPFHDLNDYLAIPRMGGLRLSPDGTWLAASVQTLSPDGKKYLTSIWRIPVPDGAGAGAGTGGQARRLTRSAEGEGGARFLPDGSLLFTSKRPDPDNSKKDAEATSALWLLPAGGGEARAIAALPGGIAAVETAARADTIVVASPVLPGAGRLPGADREADNSKNGSGDGENGGTAADDERLRKARKDAGVSAILHETVPVRYWDHDLGPDDLRLFAVTVPSEDAGDGAAVRDAGETGGVGGNVRDLTPDAGRALLNQAFAVSPDGTTVVTGWWQWRGTVMSHSGLALIDVASGKRTTLVADPEFNYSNPRFSPDGRFIVAERAAHHTPEKARDVTLVTLPVRGNGGAGDIDLLPDLDRWPVGPRWTPAGDGVFFTADENGRHPVFRVPVGEDTAGDGTAGGSVVRLTPDDGYYGDLNVADDGMIYALRMTVGEPFTPVRLDPATGEFTRLQAPGQRPELPGTLTEISAEADDGHPIRAWLVLPKTAAGAGPADAGPADAGRAGAQDEDAQDKKAPLLLWVHGGPMMSWNNWSWRWNPWLMAARGYAVLLPDPALSTGYGHAFVQRGYHAWGDRAFRDVMAITDAAVARDDIDERRTAMMGGSYGGYMANWIAGHTGRFKAIVAHASVWSLDQMFGTTDSPQFWRPQFGDPLTQPEMYEKNSPHRRIADITTPMLVIHGNKDYRVPFGEALRLWWDLNKNDVPAKFLYFPDENHWILTPGNARIWYETVEAFLAHHVLGEPWRRPDLL